MKQLPWLAVLVIVMGCGARASTPQLPTAAIHLQTPGPIKLAVAATPTPPPTGAPPSPTTVVLSGLDQYRTWMEEARILHPYVEPVDTMWRVMLCESSGNPDAVSGIYHGLFQYDPNTWAGDWNPYRDQPILDPHAQIFATAKAWSDGSQGWWGCYSSAGNILQAIVLHPLFSFQPAQIVHVLHAGLMAHARAGLTYLYL
jgi:hypothetical protein